MILGALWACASPLSEPVSCAGVPCDTPFDAVPFWFAHNAMSSAADSFFAPNQNLDLAGQLALGVRGFQLDTYAQEGLDGVWLCHGDCLFGATPAVDAFAVLAGFLDRHPDEVIALIIEPHADPLETQIALFRSGLYRYATAMEPGDPWPTLGERIAAGQRAWISAESGGGAFPGWLGTYDFAWDTDYAAETVDDFSCAPLRGDPTADLFLLNHFLTAPLASPSLATVANDEALLWSRIEACEAETGQRVDWVALDFVDLGGGAAVLDALRGR